MRSSPEETRPPEARGAPLVGGSHVSRVDAAGNTRRHGAAMLRVRAPKLAPHVCAPASADPHPFPARAVAMGVGTLAEPHKPFLCIAKPEGASGDPELVTGVGGRAVLWGQSQLYARQPPRTAPPPGHPSQASGCSQSLSARPSSVRCVGSRPGPGCSQIETHRPPGHRQRGRPWVGMEITQVTGRWRKPGALGADSPPRGGPGRRWSRLRRGQQERAKRAGGGHGDMAARRARGPEGERPGRAAALSLRGAKPDPWGLAVSRGWAESSLRRGGLAGAAGAGKRARLSGRASEVPPGSGHRGTEDAEPGVAEARQPGTSWPRGESSGRRAERRRPPRWEDPRSPMAPREARGRSADADR